jgi:hypothetical protein
MHNIKSITFSYLRNEAHYEFLYFYVNLLDRYQHVRQIIEHIYPEFTQALELEKSLIDSARSSDLTKKLEEEDARIDRDVTGIKIAVKAASYNTDPLIVEAARILQNRLKDFGNIKAKAYKEEAAAVQILVDDLQMTYAVQVTLIGLTAWVDDLVVAENRFVQFYEERNRQIANRPKERLIDVRHRLESIYRSMNRYIAASATIEENTEFIEFINELNANIDYFNEHNHRTRKKNLSVTDHTIVEPIPTQNYMNGKAITPIPIAHYRMGGGVPVVELEFGVDFSLTYRNNKEVGMAMVILHGKGKYKGIVTVTFNIARQV